MKNLMLVFLMFAAACGGGSDSSNAAESTDTNATESSERNDSSDGTCGLLSSAEVEQAIGRVVIDVQDQGIEDSVTGSCTWIFEPLTEGLFEGTSPELVVAVLSGREHYDNWVLSFPDGVVVEGIGDEANHRGAGELVFTVNGLSVQLGSFFAFDSGQEAEADAATEELGRHILGRL